MNGMEMMLQSFGVDTDEVKRNVEAAMQLVKLMNERLDSIDKSMAELSVKLSAQSGVLAMMQSKLTDIEAQVMLSEEWIKKDDWPPVIT
jgi:hypothetical protein